MYQEVLDFCGMVVPRLVIVTKLVIHGVHGLFDGHLTWCWEHRHSAKNEKITCSMIYVLLTYLS